MFKYSPEQIERIREHHRTMLMKQVTKDQLLQLLAEYGLTDKAFARDSKQQLVNMYIIKKFEPFDKPFDMNNYYNSFITQHEDELDRLQNKLAEMKNFFQQPHEDDAEVFSHFLWWNIESAVKTELSVKYLKKFLGIAALRTQDGDFDFEAITAAVTEQFEDKLDDVLRCSAWRHSSTSEPQNLYSSLAGQAEAYFVRLLKQCLTKIKRCRIATAQHEQNVEQFNKFLQAVWAGMPK